MKAFYSDRPCVFDCSHRWDPDLREWIRQPGSEVEQAKREEESRKKDEEEESRKEGGEEEKARKEEEEKQQKQEGSKVKRRVQVEETRRGIELEKETSGQAHLRRRRQNQ